MIAGFCFVNLQLFLLFYIIQAAITVKISMMKGKKKMKKIVALLLALTMVFSMCACGKTTKPAEVPAEAPKADAKIYDGVALKLWMCPMASIDEDKAFWEGKLVGFEEKTGADVTVEIVDWSELDTKLHTGWMSGNWADVTYLYPTHIYDGATGGFIEPLDEYWSEEEVADENYWDALTFNGKHYGAPFAGATADRTYTYNMDILNECGITETPTTWDEFLETCAIIKEKRPDVYTFLVNFAGSAECYSNLLVGSVFQAGGAFTTPDGETCTVDSPEVLKALEFIKALVDNGYLSQDCLGLDADTVREMFRQQKVAITNTMYPINYFADVDFNWVGTTAMKDVQDGVFNAIDCLAVNARSNNKEAAVAMLKYMRSAECMDDYNAQIYVGNGQMCDSWAAAEADPRVSDVAAHPERAMLVGPNRFTSLADVLVKYLQLMVAGEIGPEEFQARVMADMEG